MLRKHGLTSFDDFMEAEMKPLRYVKDPVSRKQVPVFGALGSDLINPWLAAAGVAHGKPVEAQPMNHSAANALGTWLYGFGIQPKQPQQGVHANYRRP
jgi:hypothetical protein